MSGFFGSKNPKKDNTNQNMLKPIKTNGGIWLGSNWIESVKNATFTERKRMEIFRLSTILFPNANHESTLQVSERI